MIAVNHSTVLQSVGRQPDRATRRQQGDTTHLLGWHGRTPVPDGTAARGYRALYDAGMREPPPEPKRASRAVSPHTIGAAVLSAALVAFILQNSHRTRVHWLIFSANLPLWLLLVITSAIAMTAAELVVVAWRHRDEDD
jgi:uncharacterized integral membrane protein